jgi:thiol:disulfide interchange protein DsbD
LFLIGLNLSGYFDITWTSGDKGERLTEVATDSRGGAQGSYVSSHVRAHFFTGVLATAVATPCTAPFMATAVGYALSAHNATLLFTMSALGLGLASPFLLISFIPILQRFLPRPGQWMVTFRQFLAFPMYASVLWLIWVLVQQTGHDGLLWSGLGLLLCTFTLWLWSILSVANPLLRGSLALILISITLSPLVFITTHQPHSTVKMADDITYSKDTLAKLLAEKKPVFVYVTAAWCITCKFNEIAIESASVQHYLKDNGIHVLVADWTNSDPNVTDFLNDFGRKGVPLYVFYPKDGGKPIILPQLLTTGNILSHFQGR